MVATQYLLCDAFLRSQNLPIDLPFDFVEYTSKCTTHMFVKMVKLGWRLWTIFLTFIAAIAILSGFYHKFKGNTVESTDKIFTTDPDDNLVFYNTFFVAGWILLFYNFRSISTTDTTFEKLIKLEMKRIRARERLMAAADCETSTNGGAGSITPNSGGGSITPNSGGGSITPNSDARSENLTSNSHQLLSPASSLSLPLLSPQGDPNRTTSTATTMDVSLGIKPHEAKWLCVKLNGKSGRETFCPCTVAEMSPYKKLFFMNAPDWVLRIYQATVLYYGLFISTYFTVFAFLGDQDLFEVYLSLLLPLVCIFASGQAFPKYASVRYFGDLARPEILEPLVDDAWAKYREGERRINLENQTELDAIRSMYELVCNEGGHRKHQTRSKIK